MIGPVIVKGKLEITLFTLGISVFKISSLITSMLSKLENLSIRNEDNFLSISTAYSFFAILTNLSVNAPNPGPISRIISVSLSSEIDIIFLAKSESTIKFCPNFLLGIIFN